MFSWFTPTVGLIIILLLFIIAIIRHIDWREKAEKWVGYDPEKAQVYIKAGVEIHTVEGKRTAASPQGCYYIFKDDRGDKRPQKIFVPRSYPHYPIHGRRVIGIEDGNLVASPLGYMPDDLLNKYLETKNQIGALEQGLAATEIMKTVSREKSFSWLRYIIIAVIAIAGLYIYNTYFKPKVMPQNPPPTSVNTTTPIPDQGQHRVISMIGW